MRFTVPFTALISAISVLAEAEVKPFAKFDDLKLRTLSELAKRQSCAAYGYVTCGDGCMPYDGDCCDSEGDFCYDGDYCTATGCCEDGEVCRAGSGGVITNYLPDITTYRYTSYSYSTRSYSTYSYSEATTSVGFIGGSGDDGDTGTSFVFDDDSTSIPTTRTSATRTSATANNAAAATTTSAASSRSSGAVASGGGAPVVGNGGAFAAAGAGQVWAAGAIAAGVAML